MLHANCSLRLVVESVPMSKALEALSALAERSPELVEGFLQGLDGASELVRVDLNLDPAVAAGECRISLQPSDSLREFLLASGAGQFDCL